MSRADRGGQSAARGSMKTRCGELAPTVQSTSIPLQWLVALGGAGGRVGTLVSGSVNPARASAHSAQRMVAIRFLLSAPNALAASPNRCKISSLALAML